MGVMTRQLYASWWPSALHISGTQTKRIKASLRENVYKTTTPTRSHKGRQHQPTAGGHHSLRCALHPGQTVA